MLHPSQRRRRILTAAALVFALAAFPLGTAAIHQFTDVPDSNIYHNDIDALVDSGVTSGCGGGKYCPSAYVTREQMAAFLNRLGALAPEKTPVVNATTVDRFNASELNRANYNSTADLAASGGEGSLTASITAPYRGYLLIWGHAELYNESSGESFSYAYCDLQVDNVVVPGTDMYQDVLFDNDPYINSDETECSPSGGYSVCPGTYTVELFVDVATDVIAYDATVMVEYVPFTADGSLPFLFCGIIPFTPADAPDARPEKAAE